MALGMLSVMKWLRFFIEEDNHRICLYRGDFFDKIRHSID